MRPSGEILEQLTDFTAWSRATAGTVTLLDYVGFVATPDLMFGFLALFSPDLIEWDGVKFMASGFSRDTYEQWVRTQRSPQDIQRVMNHVHVSTLFQNQTVSDVVAIEAGRFLAEVWSRTLAGDGLVAEAFGSGLHDSGATFFTP